MLLIREELLKVCLGLICGSSGSLVIGTFYFSKAWTGGLLLNFYINGLLGAANLGIGKCCPSEFKRGSQLNLS